MARYIDAEELINNLNRFAPESFNALINSLILKQSTADVQERKHGKWIKNDCHDTRDTWVSCNLCGHTTTVLFAFSKDYNYCPKCGAKMDKE